MFHIVPKMAVFISANHPKLTHPTQAQWALHVIQHALDGNIRRELTLVVYTQSL